MELMFLIGDTKVDMYRELWPWSTEENIVLSSQGGVHRRGELYKLVHEEAKEEKRAFQEETTARVTSVPISHRFHGQPSRPISSSEAVSKQRAELGLLFWQFSWATPYLGDWSNVIFIESYL